MTPSVIWSATEATDEGLLVVIAAKITLDPVR